MYTIVDYSSFVYFSNRKDTENKLEIIQNSALKISLGYRRSTPNNLTIADSKLINIKDRSEYLCNCYLAKIWVNKNCLTYKNVQRFRNICKNIRKRSTVYSDNVLFRELDSRN